MGTVNEKIKSRLTKPEETLRKSLSIPLKLENIENLDAIAKAMTRYSGNTITRNMLIEDAVESFIDEAIEVFAEEGIDLDIEDNDCFDTIVCPAQMGDEYRQAFFNEREWRFVRVAKQRLDKIKYIALYVSAPQSGISHYAKVADFVFDEEKRKYKIKLEGDPVQLPNLVPLGSTSPLAVRSPKYTTLQRLFVASEIKDLYETEI